MRVTAKNVTLCLLLSVIAAMAETNSIDDAIAEVRADIKGAIKDLAELRNQIEEKRAPLTQSNRELSKRVKDKRIELANLRDAQRYGEQQRHALDAEVSRLEEQHQYILSALTEYRRELETHISPAMRDVYRSELAICDQALAQVDNIAELHTAAQNILELADAVNSRRLGGCRLSGRALDSAGLEIEGAFFFAGPIGYFSGSNGAAGIVMTRFGSPYSTFYPDHSKSESKAVKNLVDGQTAAVPIDVSGGKALKVADSDKSWIEQIQHGGFVMIPLLAIGAVALFLVAWKFLELRGLRMATTESLADVIKQLESPDSSKAVEAAKELHAPLSLLICEALAYRSAPREHLEEILHERIQALLPGLERHLGTLAVLGGVAPLLGLLGTVTGMIHTFDLVTIFGTGEARLLSGGISEALITTKFGLGIAIPVLLIHAFLARRVRNIVTALENTAARFINLLKIETSEA